MSEKIKLIATEEHLTLPSYFADPEIQKGVKTGEEIAKIRSESAREFGEKRVAEMDAAGIDTQVLLAGLGELEPLTGDAQVNLASEINKFLFEITKYYPGRFEAFTAVPTSVPEAAAEEISLTVSKYGFKGVQLPGNIRGKYSDDPFFEPILERTASLGVPIYLHPFTPSRELFNVLYAGNYSQEVAQRFSTAGWGWHIEVAVHLLKMIFSGVFDRYPKLQVIVGHLGEALPYMLQRIDTRHPKSLTKLEREIGEYLRENVYYTLSGFNYLPSFLTLLLQVGADRIMFSIDTPHGNMAEMARFVYTLPICDNDKRRIGYENAEKLLYNR